MAQQQKIHDQRRKEIVSVTPLDLSKSSNFWTEPRLEYIDFDDASIK